MVTQYTINVIILVKKCETQDQNNLLFFVQINCNEKLMFIKTKIIKIN